jgi:hypothetical protein
MNDEVQRKADEILTNLALKWDRKIKFRTRAIIIGFFAALLAIAALALWGIWWLVS